jgi:hypothetical protein
VSSLDEILHRKRNAVKGYLGHARKHAHLHRNLIGFGTGFDESGRWHLRTYVTAPLTNEALDGARQALGVDIRQAVTGRFGALSGTAPGAAAATLTIGDQIAIRNCSVFGTLCGFVERDGAAHLLTCRHVLNGTAGDSVVRGHGASTDPIVAHLGQFAQLIPGEGTPHAEPNGGDWAIAPVSAALKFDPFALPHGLGRLASEAVNPQHGTKVIKAGGAAALTSTVVDISADVVVDFDGGNSYYFSDQFLIDEVAGAGFGVRGDSGSMVVDENNRAAGMLFAASPGVLDDLPDGVESRQLTAAIPMPALLSLAQATLCAPPAAPAVAVPAATVNPALEALRQQLSPHLLAIDGVTGVGVASDHLTVLLKDPSDQVRAEVMQTVTSIAPGAPIQFVATGTLAPL